MKNKNEETITIPMTDPALWARITGQAQALVADKAFLAKLRSATPPDQRPEHLLLEYLRFVYLAWTGKSSATPSEIVDRVWHAHILCTRSYETFCRATAGRILHHDPGSGDETEREGFSRAYRDTLRRYNDEFGAPPRAFWPQPATDPRGSHQNGMLEGMVGLMGGISVGALSAATLSYMGGGWLQSMTLGVVIFLTVLAAYAFALENADSPEPARPAASGRTRTKDNGSSSGGDSGFPGPLTTTTCSPGDSGGGASDGGGGGSSCGGGCGGS